MSTTKQQEATAITAVYEHGDRVIHYLGGWTLHEGKMMNMQRLEFPEVDESLGLFQCIRVESVSIPCEYEDTSDAVASDNRQVNIQAYNLVLDVTVLP